ncbi:MAG TPA: trypsin-like serine protease [Candidatus Saccharimonadia bacterium]|nr:trypsin-like serine protease [Candidatus Saccharimonadia bacterium]
MKLVKTNARGFSHEMLLIAIVLVVAVVGVAHMVASRADSSTPASPVVSSSSLGGARPGPNGGLQIPQSLVQSKDLSALRRQLGNPGGTNTQSTSIPQDAVKQDLMHNGLNSAQADNYTSLINKSSGVVDDLHKTLGGNYAGSWLDQSTQKLHVDVVSDTGAEHSVLAKHGIDAQSQVDRKSFSYDKLTADQNSLASSLSKYIQAGQVQLSIDDKDNTIDVKVAKDTPASASAQINQAVNADPDTTQMNVAATSLSAKPPAADGRCLWYGWATGCTAGYDTGGSSIVADGTVYVNGQPYYATSCSLGFYGYRQTSAGTEIDILTAGHCLAANSAAGSANWDIPIWTDKGGNWVYNGLTRVGYQNLSMQNQYGDFGLIKVTNSTALAAIFHPATAFWGISSGGGNWYPPVDASTIKNGPLAQNTPVCHTGLTTLFTCGHVTSTSAVFAEPGIPSNMTGVETSMCVLHGDSGGPVVASTPGHAWDEAVGIVSQVSYYNNSCAKGNWDNGDTFYSDVRYPAFFWGWKPAGS